MAGNATVTAAIQDILQGIARYSADHVTIGDVRKLGTDSAPWAVIYPEPPRSEQSGDWGQFRIHWINRIELWRKFDGDDLEDIIADLDDVLATLHAYPTLNGTSNCTVQPPIRVSGLQWLRPAGSAANVKPSLVGFFVTIDTVEERTTSAGEFAT